ncbi:MAG: efflux RND transporter periplasmic adaptor subunit [Arachidicoccus sp.]|nr:efflux RND transporter periplasmic adaptor subunit [Arachidicoccus sp.]
MLRNINYIIGLSVTVFLAACGNKKAQNAATQAPPPTPVVIDTVRSSSNAVYYDEYPATVTALKEVTITSQVTGYVTQILFRDGQYVTQGQELYKIDQQVYDANVQNAKANVASLEANLVKAQKDAENYHKLDAQDAIAKQQVYYADAALNSAQKQVDAAKAQVRALEANLKFTRITAPFSGTIGISNVRVGTSVVAGQTVLNSISTNNPIAADFNIDQSQLYRFEKLSTGANPNDSTFSLAFGPDVYPYYGKIYIIDRAVDPQTGTIKIRLTFNNEKNLLKPGMTGTVRVINNSGENALLIPATSIVEQLGEFNVYVVGDSSKVKQQHIELGPTIGKYIIVKQGLTEGQQVVVQGQQNLHEGSVITTDTTSSKQH